MKRVRFTYSPSYAEIAAFYFVCTREELDDKSLHQAWVSAMTTGRLAFNIYRSLAGSYA